jgi:chromosome segregation ATPase
MRVRLERHESTQHHLKLKLGFLLSVIYFFKKECAEKEFREESYKAEIHNLQVAFSAFEKVKTNLLGTLKERDEQDQRLAESQRELAAAEDEIAHLRRKLKEAVAEKDSLVTALSANLSRIAQLSESNFQLLEVLDEFNAMHQHISQNLEALLSAEKMADINNQILKIVKEKNKIRELLAGINTDLGENEQLKAMFEELKVKFRHLESNNQRLNLLLVDHKSNLAQVREWLAKISHNIRVLQDNKTEMVDLIYLFCEKEKKLDALLVDMINSIVDETDPSPTLLVQSQTADLQKIKATLLHMYKTYTGTTSNPAMAKNSFLGDFFKEIETLNQNFVNLKLVIENEAV